MKITVVRPGMLTTIQDLGRPRCRAYGVSVGGAMDTLALRTANLLLGNSDGEAGIEATVTGPDLAFDEGRWIAICGAEANPVLNGEAVPMWKPVYVPAGSVLQLGSVTNGMRVYLAVDGGFRLPQVLGGYGTDLRGGFGGLEGRRLKANDILPLGPAKLAPPSDGEVLTAAPVMPVRELQTLLNRPAVRVFPGREMGEFDADSLRAFFTEPFTVSPQSDRMGIRLEGPRLNRTVSREMLTAGVSCGTVQVPPDGRPIILMADGQPTGGYPRIAQVAEVDLPVLAQARPGKKLGFVRITLDEAERLLDMRERVLARIGTAARLFWKGRE